MKMKASFGQPAVISRKKALLGQNDMPLPARLGFENVDGAGIRVEVAADHAAELAIARAGFESAAH
jgi:hypothetical protein